MENEETSREESEIHPLSNRIWHDFHMAIWLSDAPDMDIADGLKRINVAIALVASNIKTLESMNSSPNPFFEIRCNSDFCSCVGDLMDRYVSSPPDCLAISENADVLHQITSIYPRINTCDIAHTEAYVLNRLAMGKKPVSAPTSGFDVRKYEILLQQKKWKDAVHYLRKYAKKDPFARVELVNQLRHTGIKRDNREAFLICDEKESRKIPELSALLSDYYYDGRIVVKDLDRSIEILRETDCDSVPRYYQKMVERLIERGEEADYEEALSICLSKSNINPNLLVILSNLYSTGTYVEKDLDTSIRYCLDAVERNVGRAKNQAVDLLLARSSEGDAELAYQICSRYANEGNAWAQGRLARMYSQGLYVDRNLRKAAELMREAYDAGVPWARKELIKILVKAGSQTKDIVEEMEMENDMGYNYAVAKGLLNDPEKIDEAIESLKYLAKNGRTEVVNTLVDALLKRGSEDDVKNAFEYCSRNAESGNMWSQAKLARMYRDGVAVNADTEKAKELMKAPAYHRIGWARNEYADLLIGSNTAADMKEAYRICLQGTFDDDVWCMVKLARLMFKGQGVQKNIDNAIILMRTASNRGNGTAKRELKSMLRTRGTEEDKKEIESL